MKRSLTLILALLIALSMALPVFAQDPLIVDNADLLSALQEASLTQKAVSIREDYDFEAVIVTVQSLEGASVEAYADDFYDYNGYGCGENRDGILLLLAMDEREYHITTTGYGITAFTDYGMDLMADEFVSYLSSGDYSGGFSRFLELVREYLEVAKAGQPIDINYDYQDYTFNQMTASERLAYYLKVCLGHLPIFLIIGFIISLIAVGSMKGQLKSIRTQTAASSYQDNLGLQLSTNEDLFLYSTTTRTIIATESSSRGGGGGHGGSSVHTSSSGTSHGGHSGHF